MVKKPSRIANNPGNTFIDNPLLARAEPSFRSSIVMFFLFACFLMLVARSFWLQTMSTSFLTRQGEARYAKTIELPAIRGKITDRHGTVLASSMPSKSTWASPEEVAEASATQRHSLAALLDISDAELAKRLNTTKAFVVLKRQVTSDVYSKIAALSIDGIDTRKDYKRYYPQGAVTAHVVGFTNAEDAGQDGIEMSSQKTLVGHPGSRRVIKDRLGNIIEDMDQTKPAKDGTDLQLSIDSNIQYMAYVELKRAVEAHHALAGGIVVADAMTGEILALVNLPTYDPNDRSALTGAQLRNRVLTDTFEPGSTLKPFPIALSLDQGRITPTSTFQTSPGRMQIGTAVISDSHAHGVLTTSQVIQKSSNIGTAKIALGLEPQDMWLLLSELGFGSQPKLDFPGAVTGRLRHFKKWRPIEQATMSYGHGISVSLIQLVEAYTIFARKGDLVPLTFRRAINEPVSRQIISEKSALQMRTMLESVISGEGTAPKAKVPGYRAAGKTGTAYKVEHGKYVKKYVASFVGFAPVSNPRLIVAVMVDEPSEGHFGGDVAAPVFSAVMGNALKTMKVPYDAKPADGKFFDAGKN